MDDNETIDNMINTQNEYVSEIIKHYGIEGYEVYKKKYNSLESAKALLDMSTYPKIMIEKVRICYQYACEVMEGKIEDDLK